MICLACKRSACLNALWVYNRHATIIHTYKEIILHSYNKNIIIHIVKIYWHNKHIPWKQCTFAFTSETHKWNWGYHFIFLFSRTSSTANPAFRNRFATNPACGLSSSSSANTMQSTSSWRLGTSPFSFSNWKYPSQ